MSQLLLMHVLEDPETRYPRVLADFTKRALDAVLPVKATRKADALDMIIRLDRRTFPKPADRDPSIAMQLVLVEPLITDVVLMLEVKAVKKRVKKTWARLARHRLKSQQMITALKQLISRPGADRMTVEQLRVEVCNKIGVVFDATRGTNMFAFSTSTSSDCCASKLCIASLHANVEPTLSRSWLMLMQSRLGARQE